jgi:hypothetical protein
VSECEDAVLTIVYYHFTLPPGGIAEYAKLYDDTGVLPYGVHALQEYLRAVDSCIEKGWLTVLTPEYFEQEARRRAGSPLPEVNDDCYRPGDVAFTESGFALYRLLQSEMSDPECLEQEYVGWN